MIVYSLLKVPNQSFRTTINGHSFSFLFRTFRDIVYINVTIDGTLTVSGVRGVANASLFPSSVNTAANGIFKFVCTTDDYPSYENFDGTTCRFAYIPNEDS